MSELIEGTVYRVWYPFLRDVWQPHDPEAADVPTWRPGWRYEPRGPEDTSPEWDGEGFELRTLVSLHKPGRYPMRAFYVRQWQGPEGNTFGRTNLRMTTAQSFREWAAERPRKRLLYDLNRWDHVRALNEFEAICRRHAA